MVHPLRGKCKELSEQMASENPDLESVRGYYDCPIWGKDQHWWCRNKKTGEIVDPTKDQFPSKGIGEYIEFDGMLSCETCGKKLPEEKMIFASRYPVCSGQCYGRLVGVPVSAVTS